MIYNNEDLGKVKVEAFYGKNTYIEISNDDKKIVLNFKDKINLNDLEIDKKINLIDYINWDVELVTKETYYLFDISKDRVLLTKLDDNLYNIEIDIDDPDMIYSPLGENKSFDILKINADFSFKEK